MSNILLLGAGFSRNWGGILASEAFAYLLGCPEISNNKRLKDLLWRNQQTGGFENALEEIQADFNKNPEASNRDDLVNLQNAVIRMFHDMNSGFENTNFEFQNARERIVQTFLTKFDVILTLNQDQLLEHHYIENGYLLSNGRWSGSELPGMKHISDPNVSSWANRTWVPVDQKKFQLDNHRLQPYIKLHGSSNWQKEENQQVPILVMGGNKIQQIGLFPVLSWYHELFKEQLSQPDARLMVIGYGFRDTHINDIIRQAVNKHSLKMFIIDPKGGDLLEDTLKNSLIGASRRSLSEIFGNDTIEHNKVMRFFNV